jgi:GntR family transcriptional regulator / MocR family aminotransferase
LVCQKYPIVYLISIPILEIPLLSLNLDRHSARPLFQQIYEQLRDRIVAGDLKTENRLPPSRALAIELGVSRSTTVAAYEQLSAEGFITGRQGSGYYPSRLAEADLPKRTTPRTESRLPGRPGRALPLYPGLPDMRLFPFRQWNRAIARVARSEPEAMVIGDGLFGDRRLRRAIAAHIHDWRGVSASEEQIVVTAGSADALEICVRALMRKEDCIALEDPGFERLRHFTDSLGLATVWLDVDADGARLPNPTPAQPRLAVLTPSHQFPMGGVMSANRRVEYLNWATRNDSYVIEDDYDSEFRYARRPIPALASVDTSGHVLYVGSFSKVFTAGVRLGYLVVPENLIETFARCVAHFGARASISAQRPLAHFIEDGEFLRHIRRMRRIYAERHQALIEALSAHLPPSCRFDNHHAGMQVTVLLPEDTDDRAVCEQARRQGLSLLPLSPHYAGSRPRSGLVLGFAAYSPEEITTAVHHLAGCLRDFGL